MKVLTTHMLLLLLLTGAPVSLRAGETQVTSVTWSAIAPDIDGDFDEFEAKLAALYPEPYSVKSNSVLFSPERLRIVHENIEKYDWARADVEETVKIADAILKVPNREILDLMPSPNMIRRMAGYCPHCGWKLSGSVGRRGRYDVFLDPWQTTCPSCGGSLPGFDAKAYLLSGKNQRGFFDPDKADDALLPPDPEFRETAVKSMQSYCYHYWNAFAGGLRLLANAYIYTGNEAYARKAMILALRFADLYPYFRKDHVLDDTHPGAMEQDGWEAWFMRNFALAYDAIQSFAEDEEVLRFMNAYWREHGLPEKADATELRQHLDGRIFGVVASERGPEPRTNMRRILYFNAHRGYVTPETIAVVLGDTPLGQTFRQEGQKFRFGGFKKDGSSTEGSFAYDIGGFHYLTMHWREAMRFAPGIAANLLKNYTVLAAYNLYFDLYCLDRFSPHYGDTGICGVPSYVFGAGTKSAAVVPYIDEKNREVAREYALVFDVTGQERFARIAWHLNGKTIDGLHLTLFDENPEAVREKIRAVVEKDHSSLEHSFVAPILGMAVLKSGEEENRRALWLRANRRNQTGERGWHGHADSMNLGLFGYGLNLMPDMGYMDQKPWIFGHNSVSLQPTSIPPATKRREKLPKQILSEISFTAEFPGMQVAQCEGIEDAGSRRTAFLVDVDKDSFYVADSFRVSEQIPQEYATYAFHSNQGKVEAPTPWKKSEEAIEGTARTGGKWVPPLWDVPEDAMTTPWTADITLEDTYGILRGSETVKVRFISLRPVDRISHTFYAPPKSEPEVPTRIPYLFLTSARSGEKTPRRFSTIIEPYRRKPTVRKATIVPCPEDNADVLHVVQEDGSDVTFIIPDADSEMTAPDGTRVQGRVAVVTRREDRIIGLCLCGRSVETAEGMRLTRPEGRTVSGGITLDEKGRISDFVLRDPVHVKLPGTLDAPAPRDALISDLKHENGFTTFVLSPSVLDK